MSKLKMTKTEQERAAEAAEATAGMTDEEKAAEVQAVATQVASDVDKAKPESKAKKDTRPKKELVKERLTRTPTREVKQPERLDSNPLQGATVDPDANYPKILQLQVSVGDDDERSMEEFVDDVKDALVSQANAKLATVLLSKVAIDGKHILNTYYEREVARLRPEEDDTDE